MTELNPSPLERSLRGAYTSIPPKFPGLCDVCTAPTSGDTFVRCFQCELHLSTGYQLASSVVPLSWAPMYGAHGYSGQAYQDLRSYKEPESSDEHASRLGELLRLVFQHHSACLLPSDPQEPYILSHVPSSNGRPGEHPIQTNFLSRFRPEIPRIVPKYVGPADQPRNERRVLNPNNWEIPSEELKQATRAILIEDTWVSGGHAQSIASAFESMGVRTRIIALGRALDPMRVDHGTFLRTHPNPDPFDAEFCPVQRGFHS